MISAGEKEEIRALIKVGRKRTLNFGVCIGEEPEETVFMMHRHNGPASLGRQARLDGTTAKVAKGLLEVDGRTVKLCCEGTKPTGLAKQLKKYLKLLKLNMAVELVDEVAALPSEDDEAEAAPQVETPRVAEPTAAEPAETPPAPEIVTEQARYEALAAPLAARMEAIEQTDHPKAKKLAAIWALSVKRAADGDYATAIKAVSSLPAHL